jgi:hypothetical protein
MLAANLLPLLETVDATLVVAGLRIGEHRQDDEGREQERVLIHDERENFHHPLIADLDESI